MWRRAPFLSCWARIGLVALLVGGCAAKADPFGQQVQRIDEISISGEELFSRGDMKRASRNFSRALTMSRSVDYQPGTAQQLNNLGAVALEEGDYPKARDYFTQAYNLNQEHQQWAGGQRQPGQPGHRGHKARPAGGSLPAPAGGPGRGPAVPVPPGPRKGVPPVGQFLSGPE